MVTTKHCYWGESNSDCMLFPVCLSDLVTSRPRSAIGESFVTSLFTFCFISIHFQVEKETR